MLSVKSVTVYHKQSESHTGVLAKLLNRDPGYHAIIKTRNLYDDANYDEKSFYREDLISYINQHQLKFLLDIHIMNPEHRNSIEMATGDRKNIQGNWKIIDKINKIANQAELLIDTDHHFFALNPNCIAAHIANECGIPAIQMEINWSDLDVVKGNNQHFMKIYQFLKDIQTSYKEQKRKRLDQPRQA